MYVKMSPLVVSIEFMVANKIVGYVNGYIIEWLNPFQ